MNTTSSRWAGRYLSALRTYLAQDPQANQRPAANKLGVQAQRMGLGILDLAQGHEQALSALVSLGHSPGNGNGTFHRAESFFHQTLTPIVTALGAGRAAAQSKPPHTLLTAANLRVRRETIRRKTAEVALKKSQTHHDQLLAQSILMQEQFRYLSHQILLAQEEERKHISRELHDEISQILTGINVRLAALKIEATANTGNLKKNIAHTQRLVEKSMAAVHRFARELRPAMLDDLGLIPALLAFMKEFGKRTGLHMRLTAAAPAKLEPLDNLKRTVFYRVAQEALTNIAKHAHANLAKVSLQAQPGAVCMEIHDNGKAFDVNRILGSRRRIRLGIIGMRERVEMVGGIFSIESTPNKGTTIRVIIPFHNDIKK